MFCKYCSVELPTGDFLENHLHGKKHRLALEKAGATNVEPHDCLVTVVPPGSDAGIFFQKKEWNFIIRFQKKF